MRYATHHRPLIGKRALSIRRNTPKHSKFSSTNSCFSSISPWDTWSLSFWLFKLSCTWCPVGVRVLAESLTNSATFILYRRTDMLGLISRLKIPLRSCNLYLFAHSVRILGYTTLKRIQADRNAPKRPLVCRVLRYLRMILHNTHQ